MQNNLKMKRKVVKMSLGQVFTNDLEKKPIEELPYELDFSWKYYIFDVGPMGAVRMTQSDRWKTNPDHHDILKRQRSEVTRYFRYKEDLREQARIMNFEMQGVLNIIFCVPMPNSWSEKKKASYNKMPVKTKPDIDNYLKGFMDALLKEDGLVWKVNCEKRYAYLGSVIVYQ